MFVIHREGVRGSVSDSMRGCESIISSSVARRCVSTISRWYVSNICVRGCVRNISISDSMRGCVSNISRGCEREC